MKKFALIAFLLVLTAGLFAQEEAIVKFYRNIKLENEVLERNARYKWVLLRNGADESEDLFEVKSGKLIRHKSFRDHLPFGEWYLLSDNGLKTNVVVYGKLSPGDCYVYNLKSQKLDGDVAGDFFSPKIIDAGKEVSLYAKANNVSEFAVWIAFNVRYPEEAQSNRIQGKVKTQFSIDENGVIGEIRIVEGVDETLDAEAYRLLKSMPRIKPAMLNGKAIKVFVETPINFVLQ